MLGSVVISACITTTIVVGLVLWQLETSTNIEEAIRLLKHLAEAIS